MIGRGPLVKANRYSGFNGKDSCRPPLSRCQEHPLWTVMQLAVTQKNETKPESCVILYLCVKDWVCLSCSS